MSIARGYFQGQATVLDGQYRSSFMKGNMSDTGTNREKYFSTWLLQHLPRATSPEIGGQIIDSTGHTSGQVDLVLYNDNAPRFGGNPKSYYFAEGVISAIQVKSKLTSGELSSALKNLETVKVCKLRPSAGLILGQLSDSILTGIFAFELDSKDFASITSVIDTLKRHEAKGVKPVNFVCINKKTYIAYNKGEWHSKDGQGEKSPLPNGYVEVDTSEESIFRMVLALSSEAKRNIATAVDFQPYFIEGWSE